MGRASGLAGWSCGWRTINYPLHHQVQQKEGSGFTARYKTKAGMAFVMGLNVGH
jgi:hypothetical protein